MFTATALDPAQVQVFSTNVPPAPLPTHNVTGAEPEPTPVTEQRIVAPPPLADPLHCVTLWTNPPTVTRVAQAAVGAPAAPWHSRTVTVAPTAELTMVVSQISPRPPELSTPLPHVISWAGSGRGVGAGVGSAVGAWVGAAVAVAVGAGVAVGGGVTITNVAVAVARSVGVPAVGVAVVTAVGRGVGVGDGIVSATDGALEDAALDGLTVTEGGAAAGLSDGMMRAATLGTGVALGMRTTLQASVTAAPHVNPITTETSSRWA